jgi:class 3 adenylate cyclase
MAKKTEDKKENLGDTESLSALFKAVNDSGGRINFAAKNPTKASASGYFAATHNGLNPLGESWYAALIAANTATKSLDWLSSIPAALNFSATGLPVEDQLKVTEKKLENQSQITALEQEQYRKIRELQAKNDFSESELKRVNAELAEINKNISSMKEVANILPRVHYLAGEIIVKGGELMQHFTNNNKTDAVVVSIDIRRSTELMLKAKSHEEYSEFITELTKKLATIITANFGVFDKFTGDGVLAFFPSFYSGPDSIVHAIRVSQLCHQAFQEHYEQYRSFFNVFLTDIGLGIGIDYGSVSIVNSDMELTVVGIPVVYACRFSGTAAGTTVLNGNAFDYLTLRHPRLFKHKLVAIDLKHEGPASVFMVELTEEVFDRSKLPTWLNASPLENTENKEAVQEGNEIKE